jgi:hypothetical protein
MKSVYGESVFLASELKKIKKCSVGEGSLRLKKQKLEER